VVPDEATQVRQIFQLYLDFDALLPVVEELNRRGWFTKRWTTAKGRQRGGRPFDKNSVWYTLTNVTYLGKMRYKDEIHEGEHDAIVNRDIFEKVQAKLKINGRSGGAAVRNKFGAILKGLIHCVPCKCAMTPVHSTTKKLKRYRYYVCVNAQKRGYKECPSKSIPAGEIERFVVDQIKKIGCDPRVLAETVRKARSHGKETLAELESEERRLRRDLVLHHVEMDNLLKQPVEVHSQGIATTLLASLHERIQTNERRLAEVRLHREKLQSIVLDEAEAAKSLAQFDALWESLTLREQTRLMQLMIERIDYNGHDGSISITFHPTGITALGAQGFAGDAA
jgi:site-specific DNA recombinase